MKNVIQFNKAQPIIDKRFRVEATLYDGSICSSKWFATKEEANQWRPFGEIGRHIIEQRVSGYDTFEKFGKVFMHPIFETV